MTLVVTKYVVFARWLLYFLCFQTYSYSYKNWFDKSSLFLYFEISRNDDFNYGAVCPFQLFEVIYVEILAPGFIKGHPIEMDTD
jgi:hypothetical protein